MSSTEGLLWCKSCLDEVQPEDDLTELYIGRVTETYDNDADTAGVTNEQVVGHMVRLVARELPYTHLTHACQQHRIDSEKPRNVSNLTQLTHMLTETRKKLENYVLIVLTCTWRM